MNPTPSTFTVSDINYMVKDVLTNQPYLKHLLVQGEISNFKIHSSGIWYFSLKDAQSRIKAIMFGSYNRRIKMAIQDGMSVLVQASIGVYEQGGEYQLLVENILPLGAGILYMQYEELKRKLSSEGLFDETHKQKIPLYPHRIGLITAPTGAAVHDMITTIQKRWPIAQIIIYPSLVQGKTAAPAIVENIRRADKSRLDVILLARGGGSIEDLWAFNEEIVARAIASCNTPIVTGIGHETDTTIADYVSDYRAPTPTGAALAITPSLSEVESNLLDFEKRLRKGLFNEIEFQKVQLTRLSSSPSLQDPLRIIKNPSLHLDQLELRLDTMVHHLYDQKTHTLKTLHQRLSQGLINKQETSYRHFQVLSSQLIALSPLEVLTRGYAFVETMNGQVISSIHQALENAHMKIIMHDGQLEVQVLKKENKK